MSGHLDLALPPEWGAVRQAWEPCIRHLTGQGLQTDAAQLLTMASQELLENAIKYGGPEEEELRLLVDVTADEVTIEVKGRAGDDDDLARLDDTIQWIRGHQDPFEAYLKRLKQVSASVFQPGVSGLGLTRVAYEAGCVLDFYVDESERLCMSAIWHRPRALESASR